MVRGRAGFGMTVRMSRTIPGRLATALLVGALGIALLPLPTAALDDREGGDNLPEDPLPQIPTTMVVRLETAGLGPSRDLISVSTGEASGRPLFTMPGLSGVAFRAPTFALTATATDTNGQLARVGIFGRATAYCAGRRVAPWSPAPRWNWTYQIPEVAQAAGGAAYSLSVSRPVNVWDFSDCPVGQSLTRIALEFFARAVNQVGEEVSVALHRLIYVQTFNVMTYNIRAGIDFTNTIFYDLRFLASVIEQNDADIVLLQEVYRNRIPALFWPCIGDQPAVLKQVSGMYGVYTPTQFVSSWTCYFERGNGDGDSGLMLLSRFPLLGVESVEVPLTDDVAVEVNGLRIVLIPGEKGRYQMVDIDIGGVAVRVVNTHQGWPTGVTINADIVNRLTNRATLTPALVGGDFNNGMEWYPADGSGLAPLLNANFRHVCIDGGRGRPYLQTGEAPADVAGDSTCVNWPPNPPFQDKTIDQLLIWNDLRLGSLNFGVLEGGTACQGPVGEPPACDTRQVSDHLPVVARLTFASLLSTSISRELEAFDGTPRIAEASPLAFVAGYDADTRADLAVWRPSSGEWFIINSTTNTPAVQQWGQSGDVPVPGDYDGDGRQDVAVWRPSTGEWSVIPTSLGGRAMVQQWGLSGDVPVPGDYNGDGRTDFAVWRPGTGEWFIINSLGGGTTVRQWGQPGQFGVTPDVPVPGDYDGDGRTDLAVWRPGTGEWWIINSATGAFRVQQWGGNGDVPVPGDYDGDGRTDLAIWRPYTIPAPWTIGPSEWWIISSSAGTVRQHQWGHFADKPVPEDYDGDGRTDLAVWRPSTGEWWIINSATWSQRVQQWGLNGDVPVPAR